MSDNLIASDQPLTDSQKVVLVAILDTMIPASKSGELPSAGEMDFTGYLSTQPAEGWNDTLEVLARFDEAFASRTLEERFDQLTNFSQSDPTLFGGLLRHVYACYYMQDAVLSAIGSEGGAPYPRGNTVDEGDLSLIDLVMGNAKTWRRSSFTPLL